MLIFKSSSSSSSPLFSIVIISFLFLTVSYASELSFNFPTINPTNLDIVREGDASALDSGILLTPNKTWQTGHATYAQTMHLWDKTSGALADFTTNFSFSINSQYNTSHADGLTFFIASDYYRMPDEKDGSGIGLACCTLKLNSTTNPFVAVEFDTYYNNEWDEYQDDHVGIDVNSLRSVESVRWYSSVMDGRIIYAEISYDSSSKNLSVSFTGVVSRNITVQQHLSYKIDLRDYLSECVVFGFSAATGVLFEFHTIHSWSFSSILHENRTSKKNGSNVAKLVGILIGACVLVLVSGILFFFLFFRYKRRDTEQQEQDSYQVQNEFERMTSGAKNFAHDVLVSATNNFDEKQKLGEGGFGDVFKGFLKDYDTHVAVKRVSSQSVQGISEFAAEVIIISQLRHRNLVQLIGWCHENSDLLLVYEYMPNRSLDFHLFSGENLLNWEQRYRIAQGLASALHYLHQGWRRCVLHRDIKSSNVMLDSEFNPLLGDFGLARLVDHHDARSQTLPGGSYGYIGPECLDTGKSSKESDVFSFGVVALEIACGKKPFVERGDGSRVHIVKWVWEFYANGKILNAADERLDGNFASEQMRCLMIVGLWCAHPDHSVRPSIREAINFLNFDAPLPHLSLKFPGIISHSSPSQGYPMPSSVNATFRTTQTQNTSFRSPSTSDSSKLNTFATSSLIFQGR